jgi:dTDP-glucose 4,6-dehydratase
MKKAIVTGGLGFIGSNLIVKLLKKNFKVINIDKISYASNKYNLKNVLNKKQYKFIRSDIGNNSVYPIINNFKPDVIFNLAAETHVDRSIDNPASFVKNNILSTFNLLENLKKINFKNNLNFKFIHISTDEVFGDVNKGRSSEISKYMPSSPYAASKASSDHLVYSYFKTYNLPIIITNCSNNYGPKQHPEKLIPKIIFNILNNISIPIYGNGKNQREWIYVEDHCDALIKIFNKGKIGNFYNIGSNVNYTNLVIAKKLLQISRYKYNLKDIPKIIFVKDRPGHDKRYAISSNKIFKELNWKKKIDLNTGLLKTFDWYFKNMNYYKKIRRKDIMLRLGNIND